MTIKSIPNLLTGTRLAAIPVLWVFALLGSHAVVGVGIAVAWLTDALDGFLARRLHAHSAWGSRFDSIADVLLFVSGLAWVAMLRPEFVREHALLLFAWVAIGAAAYLIGWVRFRRVADVHLYSAKVANFFGFLFVANLLTFGEYPPLAFYLVIGICLLAAMETLIALAAFDRVDEHMVSVLFRLRPRQREPSARAAPRARTGPGESGG
jgi:phosphatidylglycerophosphate synthase